MNKNDKKIAKKIIELSEGADVFWFGLHKNKTLAKKKVERLNTILRGTGAKAKIEFARNYNRRGYDWGSIITNFTISAENKLKKKFNL